MNADSDPLKSRYIHHGRSIGETVRWLLVPAGKVFRAASVVSCLSILWGISHLPFGWYMLSYGTGLGLILLCYFIVAALLRAVAAKWFGYPGIGSNRGSRVLIVILLICVAIGNAGTWPFIVVLLHRPLLDRYARHLYYDIPMPKDPLVNQRIGLVYFSEVNVTPSGIYCKFPAAETVLKWDEDQPKFMRSLSGNWYVVYDSWDWWWSSRARE